MKKILDVLNFLINDLRDPLFTAYLLITFIISMIGLVMCYLLATLIMDDAKRYRPSFVVLSRRAEAARAVDLRLYSRGWRVFLWAFAVAILTSMLGNLATWVIF